MIVHCWRFALARPHIRRIEVAPDQIGSGAPHVSRSWIRGKFLATPSPQLIRGLRRRSRGPPQSKAGIPASLEAPYYPIPPLVSTILVYFLGQRSHLARGPIVAFDALGLGVFVTTGTTIGLAAGVPTASAILLGVLTGVGGGMIRDVLVNEIPAVFNASDLYILPAVTGAGFTAIVWHLGWYGPGWTVGIAVFVFAFRMLAWWFEWRVPLPMRRWSYRSVRVPTVFRRASDGEHERRRSAGVFAPRRRNR